MRKKVLIVSEYQIHLFNGAAYERIKCYAMAVPEVDFFFIYIDLNLTHGNEPNNHDGIKNLFFYNIIYKHHSYLYRNFIKYFDFYHSIQVCKFILKKFPSSHSKVLLYSSNLPLFLSVLCILKYQNKYTVIVEKNELETGIISNLSTSNVWLRMLYFVLYPFKYLTAYLTDYLTNKASKVISISTSIKEKYASNVICTIIPVLVDIKRFNITNSKPVNKKVRFVYLGALTMHKDCLDEILHFFCRLNLKYDCFKLDIFGTGNRFNINSLKQFIENNNLGHIISYKDSIESKKVPIILRKYDYGLLLRNRNKQTQYGFSTKLGEYLAAGLPVIFTDVSDNLLYLNDEVHGFFAPFPLEVNLETVLEKAILSNLIERQRMGKNARELAQSKFDCNIFSKELGNIFN